MPMGAGVEELPAQLADISFTSFELLEEHGYLARDGMQAIRSLLAEINAITDSNFWQDEGLADPVWTRIRRQAAGVIRVLDNHLAAGRPEPTIG